jgi:hypothetical protein
MNVLKVRQFLSWERDLVAALTATITDNIASLADVSGMILLPLVPATLTALNLYLALLARSTWPVWAATLVAVLVGGGLESLGIAASKTAMRLYRAYRDKLSLLSEVIAVILTTAIYVALVTAIIAFGEGLPQELRWIGYASPLLAVSMYVVVGFNADIQARRDRELEATNFERDLDNELRIAQLGDKKARLALKREQDMLAYQQRLNFKRLRDEAKLQDAGSRLALSPTQRKVEARRLLAENPEMTGAELGRYFGLTARAGQILKKEIYDR